MAEAARRVALVLAGWPQCIGLTLGPLRAGYRRMQSRLNPTPARSSWPRVVIEIDHRVGSLFTAPAYSLAVCPGPLTS